eukprot:12900330-Prorocentrum_lima.AAC.1
MGSAGEGAGTLRLRAMGSAGEDAGVRGGGGREREGGGTEHLNMLTLGQTCCTGFCSMVLFSALTA